MKKICLLIILLITLINFPNINSIVYAKMDYIYSIYDKNGHLLFQQEGVEVGDMYMGKDFVKYIVRSINTDTYTGIAEEYAKLNKPNVELLDDIYGTNISKENNNICLYMTHNDESYLPSDGYDSIYGNGGILDVSNAFKANLENLGVNVVLDDTLHIPHDNYAYSRSKSTATSLYNKYTPDAIFDMHRDATSRSVYLANVDGKNMGKVRIVLGLANPYLEENEQFAIYLLSIAEEMYPWLFLDIYYGKGHYNQSISSKALLFEMGCHLIEKEYEIASTKPLAEVICTALYKTAVNEDSGDLTVNGTENSEEIKVNDVMNSFDEERMDVLEDSTVETKASVPNIESMLYQGIITVLLSLISIVSISCIVKQFIIVSKKK